jgi:hypothetical protein
LCLQGPFFVEHLSGVVLPKALTAFDGVLCDGKQEPQPPQALSKPLVSYACHTSLHLLGSHIDTI